jgi:hypothetical protein
MLGLLRRFLSGTDSPDAITTTQNTTQATDLATPIDETDEDSPFE